MSNIAPPAIAADAWAAVNIAISTATTLPSTALGQRSCSSSVE